ncbi:methyltetrahydrofolate cobalamin methyltransferase [Alkalibacter mobilis]|uniref:methyltetrahydrofolate cobalamin methyltransferase n=1 Tax=Alkalibacter mobilis TaxID=2787712 RepID=UPI00189C8285|nr:methyltetrahydrofolate cobalamin methyltransferase [Alkalibacter mobilis]MBF7095681.1 methyltetrahydrofolate cobalamin methyltransferase [Alkalibacter mobilis]MBF7096572.1 methyltetrahydrofolate cobalamin methyltransferase [Alkalibacter mobilis]
MIIIGEKINGAIPAVKKAIQEKDADFIRDRAIKQAEAGADFIDVCASTAPDVEVETLKWLIDIVQDAVDTPICIDSPDPFFLKEVLPFIKKPGLINSVNLEKIEGSDQDKCDVLFPLVEGTEWEVIALTCDSENGTPRDVETRVEISKKIIEKAATFGITPDKIHIDPLVMALSTDNNSLLNFVESMKQVKAIYPTVKFTSGLSNISFGMPKRKIINQNFMTLAIYEGMDSAIMDPLNKEIMGSIFATEALLGRDKHTRKYNAAVRKERI